MTSTVGPGPSSTSRRTPLLVAAVIPVVTLVVLWGPGRSLGSSAAFLPAWLTLVLACDLLTAVLLVGQYRAGAGPRMLVLSGAYLWSAGLLVVTAVSTPGLATAGGALGGDPAITWWLWTLRHIGFPVLVAVALMPWPVRVKQWLSNPHGRNRRVLITQVGLAALLSVVVGAVLVLRDRLPGVARAVDQANVIGRPLAFVVLGISLGSLGVAILGVVRRGARGLEVWAVVAATAACGEVLLVGVTSAPFTLGWYAARALALAAALAVLLAMLTEVVYLPGHVRAYAAGMEAQNLQLREAQSLRDHLTAVVSHDLRTPIAGLMGYLEVLQDDEDLTPAIIRRMHERSLLLTKRLSLLTEDLLAVATVDHGDLQILSEPHQLARQLTDCASAFPGLDLQLSCEPGLEVIADSLRLQQMLANLVRNAQNHGSEPITLGATRSVCAVPGRSAPTGGTEDRLDVVRIVVSDAGPGVPASFRPRLFERYTRADDRDTSGSGLGLSVVRDLAVAHGGTASYEAETNSFVIELPAPTRFRRVPSTRRAPSPVDQGTAPGGLGHGVARTS